MPKKLKGADALKQLGEQYSAVSIDVPLLGEDGRPVEDAKGDPVVVEVEFDIPIEEDAIALQTEVVAFGRQDRGDNDREDRIQTGIRGRAMVGKWLSKLMRHGDGISEAARQGIIRSIGLAGGLAVLMELSGIDVKARDDLSPDRSGGRPTA